MLIQIPLWVLYSIYFVLGLVGVGIMFIFCCYAYIGLKFIKYWKWK